ncbi:MAG: hypothetical protein LUF82_02895 [Clostridia bacterium]|nr:hypothetical protein [Clostridia bacterium]
MFVFLFVYLPYSLVSYAVLVFTTGCSSVWNKRVAFYVPAAFAVADGVILLVLVNVLFRVIVAVV